MINPFLFNGLWLFMQRLIGPSPHSGILQEDGFYILQEDGRYLLQE